MKGYTRKYFFEISDDRTTLFIGDGWTTDNELNHLGKITRSNENSFVVSLIFKASEEKTINLQDTSIDYVIDALKDYFSTDDFAGLCTFLFLWGQSMKIAEYTGV